jgi:hypothetical protein
MGNSTRCGAWRSMLRGSPPMHNRSCNVGVW